MPQGQWFSTLLAAPQWSPIPAPLPAEAFVAFRGERADRMRCIEVIGEGKPGERLRLR